MAGNNTDTDMDEDEIHRTALFKALAEEIEAIPSAVKQVIVEKNLDRLIVLAGLSDDFIRDCDLSQGHKLFFSYLVAEIKRITVPVLNKTVNDYDRQISTKRHKAPVFIEPARKSRKKPEKNSESSSTQMDLDCEDDVDFNSRFYKEKIAGMAASFLNERGRLTNKVNPSNLKVSISKRSNETPLAQLECYVCQTAISISFSEPKPGIFYPTLSNFHKHYGRAHANSTTPIAKNRDIRTSFFFNKSTRQKQENQDRGGSSNTLDEEADFDPNTTVDDVLNEEVLEESVLQDEGNNPSRIITEEQEKETEEETYAGPQIVSIADIEILTPDEDIVFDFNTDKKTESVSSIFKMVFQVNSKSSKLYFTLKNPDGKEVFIKKSTVVWLYNNVKDTVSSDRLYRFVRSNDFRIDPINTQRPGVHEGIYVGDWCQFTYHDRLVVGNVVGFQYCQGVGRAKSYTLDHAPVKAPENSAKRGIFVYANWFDEKNNEYHLADVAENRITIENYVKHVSPLKITSHVT